MDEVGRRLVGQHAMVERLLIGLLTGGHILLEGVPGLAKTLAVRTLAEILHATFSRIQFTPDLLPADVIGTMIFDQKTQEFHPKKGPLFAHIVLADEINRAPAKVQSALLEAMQERQVTIGGTTYPLPEPFLVLATQNPIEQEGTYPLPEAQLDRFMFMIHISYPRADEELEIVRRSTTRREVKMTPVLSHADILRVQELVREAPVADHVIRYALRLVRATRIKEPMDQGLVRPQIVSDYVAWGAGPRASEYLVLAAKARAILSGSYHVTPEHIKAVAKPVLRHRILTNFNAEADQVTTEKIIDGLLEEIPVEGLTPQQKKQMDAVMR
jgi:MoxR-like ATPase